MTDMSQSPDAVAVIVVGSFEWSKPEAVRETLVGWWDDHDRPPVRLITSGCPRGAELTARSIGLELGWELIQIRDEQLPELGGAIAFLFIKDYSVGATQALEWIEQGKLWHRVVRDDTERIVSPWATR